MISTLIGLAFSLFGGETIVYAAVEEEPPVVLKKEVLTIEDRVRREFEDVPIMIEVARCESGFKNVPSVSGDFGPFQINQVHLEEMKLMGLNRIDVDDNLKFARILYARNGLRDWKNSEHCWGKHR